MKKFNLDFNEKGTTIQEITGLDKDVYEEALVESLNLYMEGQEEHSIDYILEEIIPDDNKKLVLFHAIIHNELVNCMEIFMMYEFEGHSNREITKSEAIGELIHVNYIVHFAFQSLIDILARDLYNAKDTGDE